MQPRRDFVQRRRESHPQINAERLAHHDARFFLLPYLPGANDDFITTSSPNVMELQHALRVRGTFVAEPSKTKLLDLLENNRSLLIFPSDFTRAAEAPGKINARDNADEPHNPAKHTKLFAEGVRSQAMLADAPPATFSWDDIVKSAPFSESDELENCCPDWQRWSLFSPATTTWRSRSPP